VKKTGTNPLTMMEITSAEGRVPTTGHINTPLAPTTIDLYLTAKEAARIVNLHPVTLLKWAREGDVPHIRLSPRKILFPLSRLNQWLADYTKCVSRAA
jgi:excisionase family DNA binding protein